MSRLGCMAELAPLRSRTRHPNPAEPLALLQCHPRLRVMTGVRLL